MVAFILFSFLDLFSLLEFGFFFGQGCLGLVCTRSAYALLFRKYRPFNAFRRRLTVTAKRPGLPNDPLVTETSYTPPKMVQPSSLFLALTDRSAAGCTIYQITSFTYARRLWYLNFLEGLEEVLLTRESEIIQAISRSVLYLLKSHNKSMLNASSSPLNANQARYRGYQQLFV